MQIKSKNVLKEMGKNCNLYITGKIILLMYYFFLKKIIKL